jgi:hypothetical protein
VGKVWVSMGGETVVVRSVQSVYETTVRGMPSSDAVLV